MVPWREYVDKAVEKAEQEGQMVTEVIVPGDFYSDIEQHKGRICIAETGKARWFIVDVYFDDLMQGSVPVTPACVVKLAGEQGG